MNYFIFKLQHMKIQKEEEDLDPEDVELDEHYTIETRSKCKLPTHSIDY